ncbi:anti-sigma factor [Streptomyces sp. NBC_01283]|uniref:anti-sigma factor n=1 Tax=Streptomyces sp. NBC_01283 TaxID=2903812 RepID=UPI00352E0413|nr:anti-sigma factor [Streptomyces sp. NBC_01283]
MSSADLHTLTGAYVLHALSDEERADFERHLRECEACAQEVRELAATAGRLARAVSVTPPATMKTEVLRSIATVRQLPPHTPTQGKATGGSGRGRRLSRFALAACLAAAAGFGGIAVWQHERADEAGERAQEAQRQSEQLAQVLAAPDAKAATARLTDGATGTVVVAKSRNQAAFVAAKMPEPPSGKVYQLWFNDDGSMRSAGLMDPARSTEAVLLDGPVDQASGIGITVEPTGGSKEPTSDPVALMNFPTA